MHPLLARVLVEIRYQGRRSGTWYSLPAQYALSVERPADVVVYPGHPYRKVWWRSFLEDAPCFLVLRGVEVSATGRVVEADHAQRTWAVDTYRGRFRKVRIRDEDPIVVFTVDDGGVG